MFSGVSMNSGCLSWTLKLLISKGVSIKDFKFSSSMILIFYGFFFSITSLELDSFCFYIFIF